MFIKVIIISLFIGVYCREIRNAPKKVGIADSKLSPTSSSLSNNSTTLLDKSTTKYATSNEDHSEQHLPSEENATKNIRIRRMAEGFSRETSGQLSSEKIPEYERNFQSSLHNSASIPGNHRSTEPTFQLNTNSHSKISPRDPRALYTSPSVPSFSRIPSNEPLSALRANYPDESAFTRGVQYSNTNAFPGRSASTPDSHYSQFTPNSYPQMYPFPNQPYSPYSTQNLVYVPPNQDPNLNYESSYNSPSNGFVSAHDRLHNFKKRDNQMLNGLMNPHFMSKHHSIAQIPLSTEYQHNNPNPLHCTSTGHANGLQFPPNSNTQSQHTPPYNQPDIYNRYPNDNSYYTGANQVGSFENNPHTHPNFNNQNVQFPSQTQNFSGNNILPGSNQQQQTESSVITPEPFTNPQNIQQSTPLSGDKHYPAEANKLNNQSLHPGSPSQSGVSLSAIRDNVIGTDEYEDDLEPSYESYENRNFLSRIKEPRMDMA